MRRRSRFWRAVLATGGAIAVAVGTAACGGGSKSTPVGASQPALPTASAAPIGPKRVILSLRRLTKVQSSAAADREFFQSPSGNIRCEYLGGTGVACMTLNNGYGVLIRSFDTSYYLDNPYQFEPPPGRTVPYGYIWVRSSFRCTSSTAGMRCWSTVTGHGFFISRTQRNIY